MVLTNSNDSHQQALVIRTVDKLIHLFSSSKRSVELTSSVREKFKTLDFEGNKL